MKNSLEILKKEHAVARDAAAILRFLKEQLGAGKTISLLYIRDFLEAAGKFLHAHHKKEMEVFPYLSANEKIGRDDLLEVLSQEHQLGYEYLDNIFQIIGKGRRAKNDREELLPFHLERFIEILDLHIKKEEKEFFPLVGKHITNDQDIKLEKEFVKIDERFGNRKSIWTIGQAKDGYLKK